jgi:hypothetical protein
MLKKLLKYEAKSYARVLPLLYAITIILPAISAYAGLSIITQKRETFLTVMISLTPMLFFTAFIVTFFQVIRRFRKSLLSNEAYLTLTLPVSSQKILFSKVSAAMLVFCLSTVAVLIAGGIYVLALSKLEIGDAWGELSVTLNNFKDTLFERNISPLHIVLYTIMSFSFILEQICLLYTVLTASHMLPKFRGPFSFLLWVIVSSFIISPIHSLITKLMNDASQKTAQLLSSIGTELVLAVIFFLLCDWLLVKTVNLA